MIVAVLGAGAWGTALAKLLTEGGHQVVLWGHRACHIDEILRASRNERYLPGIDLPAGMRYVTKIEDALPEAGAVVMAVPSKAFREVTGTLVDYAGILVSVTKGIEYESGLTMSGILSELATRAEVAALSGPTLAFEVGRGIPAAIVAASRSGPTAVAVQALFHRPHFRVYTSTDLLGVEMGGALKNVVALAAGVCDGLGFGDNSKAALITRGMAEIRRLGVACGAQAETFSGLSGLGDLTVTCFSKLSRNRGFGERIGRGEKLADVVANCVSVAEGYPTARSAYRLGRQHNISTPIIDQVYAMLYEGKTVAKGIRDLMSRESKAED